jgi:phage-related protein
MKVGLYKTLSGRSPIEDFILGLPKEDQAKFFDVYRDIKKMGFGCPGVTFRHLSGKLWEIKFSSEGGGFRIAYVLIDRDEMFWLHVFRKTSQKTPRKDLELALKRMREVLQ